MITLRCNFVLCVVLIVLRLSGKAEAARILGIFPTPSISHQLPYQALMKGLAAKGHEVTVISPDPLKEPVKNYTDIDISFTYLYKERNFEIDESLSNSFTFIIRISKIMVGAFDEQVKSLQMRDFLRANKNKTFDLAILEWNCYYSYFGLIHALGSPPTVGIVSYSSTHASYNDLSAPNNPAVNPQMFLQYSDEMTFWQRVFNTYAYLWLSFGREMYVKSILDEIMRKHFGSTLPDISEFQYNMSLLVVNSDWLIDYPRAVLPNMVQIVGVHIKDETKPLPKDLQQWMDDSVADGGVVYFSLGSNVLSKDLPPSKRTAILRAFARLPMKVLWKFEADELPGLPANVRVSKWLPQQAVLAHPNVRLFITQGGLQSFQEAVYHAVPLLAIPYWFDQHFNAKKIVTSKIGEKMDYFTLDENSLYSQIMDIIRNQSYKDNARRLSTLFREHRVSSLENALWWVDYVLRHKGAPHLRSSSLHLTWYQYLLLDVVAVVLLASYVLYFVIRTTFRLLHDIITNQKNIAVRK